ncbi:hypothetical protein WJX72_003708 [[Myrmecia] bisecta]|uniref:Pescadillo homolog n=1 Tax=[Myrmecia] bisecta TaxID=41462 RepID=A0AAW1PMG7_9CHLO
MGQKRKRGQAGNAVQYITRNQALKKLQLKLSEFRRLCILKGIHPREPKKKTQGANKTYYHLKDINYLAHEPLLVKFRDAYAYEKKIRKAKAKKNRDLAERLLARKPKHRIDHLVKERYPSFVDALRDLDDPLTMVHLFATLPAEKALSIPAKMVHASRRLAMEFQAYVVRTNALRKVFVSVKGFYYQAELMGQAVTWLVPHNLAQMLPTDVDYRVMLTFLEFYQTMLQFVNFKLYHMLGLKYPPVMDARLEQAAAGLAAIMQDLAKPAIQAGAAEPASGAANPDAAKRLKTLPQKLKELQQAEVSGAEPMEAGNDADVAGGLAEDDEAEAAAEDSENEELGDIDSGPTSVAGGAVGVNVDNDAEVCEKLFAGLVFFLGREVPREQLLFVIRAFGGTAAWDGEGSPLSENDESITHQVVDRPTQGHRFLSREYVQPQWVFDSANFRVLVKPELYAPGTAPPPHLSPFTGPDEDDYVPDYLQELRKLQEAAKAARLRSQGLEQDRFVGEEDEVAAGAGPADADVDSVEAAEKQYAAELTRELQAANADEAEQTSDEDNEGEDEQQLIVPKAAAKTDEAAEEEAAMKNILMPRKTKKLYDSIQKTRSAKRARVEKLQQKKQALASARKKQ